MRIIDQEMDKLQRYSKKSRKAGPNHILQSLSTGTTMSFWSDSLSNGSQVPLHI